MRENDNDLSRSPVSNGRIKAQQEPRQQALKDIEFIKQLMAKNQRKLDQSSPYLYIWGANLMVGYIGMQFNLTLWPAWYWPIGAVVGMVLSAIVGIRQSRSGNVQEGGSYGWMFWVPFLFMMITGVFMMATKIVRAEDLSVFWFLLLGMAYASLGALVGRGPVMLGLWCILLAMVTGLFFQEYQFLILGLLGGGGNIAAGWILHRRSKRHG
ncbi:hypothetical protein [Paenibacillus spongiae]|uniref:Uncharacterized protein n=1 Tax=Paenibacillus spongiae TaxID=2909671 RepID=A0ABY5SDC9_9BACL|nr:hypothetical protein [Paenibacillus spongiae]UVI30777.1 hypothetical protein L1F29_02540 [Paenibacillus spongiae]